MPVLDRAPANLGAWRYAEAQCVHELIQEHGHPVIDLRFGGRWNRPAGDLRPATQDDLFAVDGNEFMEHETSRGPWYGRVARRNVQNSTARVGAHRQLLTRHGRLQRSL